MSDPALKLDTEVVINLRKLDRDIANISKKFQRAATIRIDDRASLPLGRITGLTKDFDSSLNAATQRVVAFGAAAAVFNSIQNSFTELVKSVINVEDALAKINVNLGQSEEQIRSFSSEVFRAARETGKTFEDAAKGAEELARQGLGAEETIVRLKDALILSRLAGVDTASAVESLTAAVNSFSAEALTSTEILNKFVAVDTRFAVSTNDLREAISRVGSTAAEAGVSLDQLNGIVTAVQQSTARGGAVIGNAFKTIFTRISRPETITQLEQLGVAVKDVAGNTLPALQILKNFAAVQDNLSVSQRQSVKESIAGVFQINILNAALSDLGKNYGVAERAQRASSSATDEASQKNAKLNETLKSQLNASSQLITQFFAKIGDAGASGPLEFFIKQVNSALSSINSTNGEGAGKTFGEGLIQGIANVLSGPGLIIALGTIFKAVNLVTSAISRDIKGLMDVTGANQKRLNIENQIASVIAKSTKEEYATLMAVTSIAEKKAQILAISQRISAEENRTNIMNRSLVNSLAGVKGFASKSGRGFTAASGYLPAQEESVAIQHGVGGAPKTAKPVKIPNFSFGGGKRGTVIANSSEYIVPNYANGGSAIFNQEMIQKMGLPEGAKKINAAGGYVPNFALPSDSVLRHYYKKAKKAGRSNYRDWDGYGEWDWGGGGKSKSPMLFRGTREKEVNTILKDGTFQSYWNDPYAKKNLTWMTSSFRVANAYSNRAGRSAFVQDNDPAFTGNSYVMGLNKSFASKGNMEWGGQGDTALNFGSVRGIKDSDIRSIFSSVGGKTKPLSLGEIKEMAGLSPIQIASGYIPNFANSNLIASGQAAYLSGGAYGDAYRLGGKNIVTKRFNHVGYEEDEEKAIIAEFLAGKALSKSASYGGINFVPPIGTLDRSLKRKYIGKPYVENAGIFAHINRSDVGDVSRGITQSVRSVADNRIIDALGSIRGLHADVHTNNFGANDRAIDIVSNITRDVELNNSKKQRVGKILQRVAKNPDAAKRLISRIGKAGGSFNVFDPIAANLDSRDLDTLKSLASAANGYIPNFANPLLNSRYQLGGLIGQGSYKDVYNINGVQDDMFGAQLNPQDLVMSVMRKKNRDFDKLSLLRSAGGPAAQIFETGNLKVDGRLRHSAVMERLSPLHTSDIDRLLGPNNSYKSAVNLSNVAAHTLAPYLKGYRNSGWAGNIKGDLRVDNFGIAKGADRDEILGMVAELSEAEGRPGPYEKRRMQQAFGSGLKVLDAGFLRPNGFAKGYVPNFANPKLIASGRATYLNSGAYGDVHSLKGRDVVTKSFKSYYNSEEEKRDNLTSEFIGGKILAGRSFPGVNFIPPIGKLARSQKRGYLGKPFIKNAGVMGKEPYNAGINNEIISLLKKVGKDEITQTLLNESGLWEDMHSGNFGINDRGLEIVRNINGNFKNRGYDRNLNIATVLSRIYSDPRKSKRFFEKIGKAGGEFNVYDGLAGKMKPESLNKLYSTGNYAGGVIPNFAKYQIKASEIPKYIMGGHDFQSLTYASKRLGRDTTVNAAQHSTQVRNDLKVGASPGAYPSWTRRQTDNRMMTVRGLFEGDDEAKIKNIKWDKIKSIRANGNDYDIISGAAGGYVPNFANPLHSAISREISAGVNPRDIYVDSDSRVKGAGNPFGLLIANRRDEPNGGHQGVTRAMTEGLNPKSYGAARGFVPNFAEFDKLERNVRGGKVKDYKGNVSILPYEEQILSSEAKKLRSLASKVRTAFTPKEFTEASKELEAFGKTLGLTNAGFEKINKVNTNARAKISKVIIERITEENAAAESASIAAKRDAEENAIRARDFERAKKELPKTTVAKIPAIKKAKELTNEQKAEQLLKSLPKQGKSIDTTAAEIAAFESTRPLIIHRNGGGKKVSAKQFELDRRIAPGTSSIAMTARLAQTKMFDEPTYREMALKKQLTGLSNNQIGTLLSGQNLKPVGRTEDIRQLRGVLSERSVEKNGRINTDVIQQVVGLARSGTLATNFNETVKKLVKNGTSLEKAYEAASNDLVKSGGTGKQLSRIQLDYANSLSSFESTVKEQRLAAVKQTKIARSNIKIEALRNNTSEALIKSQGKLENLTRKQQAIFLNDLREQAKKELGYGGTSRADFNSNPLAVAQVDQLFGKKLSDTQAAIKNASKMAAIQIQEKMASEDFKKAQDVLSKQTGYFMGGRKDLSSLKKAGVNADSPEIRELLENRKSRREARFGNAALTASFAAPMLAGFLPEGKGGTAKGRTFGALSQGLQFAATGASLGSFTGSPTGIAVGAVVGGVFGTTKGFLDKLNKSAGEYQEELDTLRSKEGERLNGISTYIELQERLNNALKDAEVSGDTRTAKIIDAKKKEVLAKLSPADRKLFQSFGTDVVAQSEQLGREVAKSDKKVSANAASILANQLKGGFRNMLLKDGGTGRRNVDVFSGIENKRYLDGFDIGNVEKLSEAFFSGIRGEDLEKLNKNEFKKLTNIGYRDPTRETIAYAQEVVDKLAKTNPEIKGLIVSFGNFNDVVQGLARASTKGASAIKDAGASIQEASNKAALNLFSSGSLTQSFDPFVGYGQSREAARMTQQNGGQDRRKNPLASEGFLGALKGLQSLGLTDEQGEAGIVLGLNPDESKSFKEKKESLENAAKAYVNQEKAYRALGNLLMSSAASEGITDIPRLFNEYGAANQTAIDSLAKYMRDKTKSEDLRFVVDTVTRGIGKLKETADKLVSTSPATPTYKGYAYSGEEKTSIKTPAGGIALSPKGVTSGANWTVPPKLSEEDRVKNFKEAQNQSKLNYIRSKKVNLELDNFFGSLDNYSNNKYFRGGLSEDTITPFNETKQKTNLNFDQKMDKLSSDGSSKDKSIEISDKSTQAIGASVKEAVASVIGEFAAQQLNIRVDVYKDGNLVSEMNDVKVSVTQVSNRVSSLEGKPQPPKTQQINMTSQAYFDK